MADIGSLRVNIDGSDAIRQAQQVGQAVTAMGTAATGATTAFGKLQDAAKQPIGAAVTANNVVALAASLERARQVQEQLNESTAAGASLGGAVGAQFREVAQASEQMAAAMAAARGIVTDMIAGGASMEEIYTTLREQVQSLPSAFDLVSASSRTLFSSMEAIAQEGVQGTKEYKNALDATEASILKQAAAVQKATQAEVDARAKEVAAAESAAAKATAAKERQMQREAQLEEQATRRQATRYGAQGAMMQSPFGAVSGSMMNIMMGAQMMGQGGPMGGMMGVQMLGAGLTEASAGATAFGAAFAILSTTVVAGIAVFAAAGAAVKVLGDALKEAGEEEKLSIQLKNIYGSATQATQAMSDLKTFSQSATGGIFNLSDLEAGQRQLLLATGGFIDLKTIMPEVANAAAESGKSFSEEASQIGKVYSALQTGNPARAMLIQQLVTEGAISEATRIKIENMAKAHASAASILQVFVNGLKEGGNAATDMGNTVEGLGQRIQKAFSQDFLEPLGAALEPVVKNIEQAILGILQGHSADIQTFADGLERAMLTAFFLVRDQGLVGAFKAGVDQVGQYISDQWGKILQTLAQAYWDDLKSFSSGFFGWFGDQFNSVFKVAGQTIAALLQSASGKAPGQYTSATDAVNIAQEKLNALTLAGAPDEQIQAAVKALISAQNAAAKDMNDAGSKIQNATAGFNQSLPNLVKGATQFGENAANAFVNAPAFKSFMQGFSGLPGGPLAPQAPFPGAVRAMSEWMPGQPMTTATQWGAAGTHLQLGDVAMSTDLMAKMNIKLGDYIDILDKSGNVLLAHQHVMDTSWLPTKPGVAQQPGWPVGNMPSGGIEMYGRPDIGYAQIRPSGAGIGTTGPMAVGGAAGQASNTQVQAQTQLTALEKAQKEADDAIAKDKAASDASTKGMLGTMPGVVNNTKAGAAATKLMDDEIKAATTAIAAYGAKVTIINEQEKAGQISIQTAQKEKNALYQQEINYIQQTIDKLKSQEAAVKAANPTADVTKYDDAISKLNNDLAKTKQAMSQLQEANPWQSFLQGVQQATNAWGTFSQQFTKLGTQMTDELASGLTAGLTALESGTGKTSDAFKQMALSIVNSLQQMIIKMLLAEAIQSVLGTIGGGAGAVAAPTGLAVVGAQGGGMIYGPAGTDKVASNLTAGEFVVTKSAVDKYGLTFLDQLNQGQVKATPTTGHASGGFINPGTSPQNTPPSAGPTSGSGGGTTTIATTVNVAPAQAASPSGGNQPMSKNDAQQLQNTINAAVKQQIAIEKRPGGLLNKNAV